MTVRTLEDIRLYLNNNSNVPGSQTPQEQYEHIEMLAIAILDGAFDLHPEGVLEEFLMDYLATKRKQLGL